MATAQEKITRKIRKNTQPEIDRQAPAGSKNSLGAESVRDSRPSTDDSTVEAIDEMGPGVTAPLSTDKPVDGC